MRHVLFIRSYERDIRWLQYCLRSIQKNVTGFTGIHVVVPASQKQAFKQLFPGVQACGIYSDDYLGQQATKLQADVYACKECFITFIDSDCCFHRPFDMSELLEEGDPIFMKTPYYQVGDARAWQAPTEEFIGHSVPFEYMRRLPITVKGSHLFELREWCKKTHGLSIDEYILQRVKGRQFSEFNIIGAWLNEHYENDYAWLNTDKQEIPPPYLVQNWSWGGLTPQVEERLEEILK